MSIADRNAQTIWDGPLASGHGSVTSGSGALGTLDVTWAARTEAPGGKTSPEELLAAAHSSCFAMALGATLAEHKKEAQRLAVSATVTLDEVDGKPTITTSHIVAKAQIGGLTSEEFAPIAEQAAALCPVSRLFAGAKITVDASLETS
ncbi:OsmC family peroxiredoxin [Leekyejoonella antrihumi]|uniref:OsmC family peroxiredoxin n=1 Tax=Leekyejoonella antrihumi TaxID=1660198 RepID=A0A563DVA9_9MICO|nr:OsmC family peroxiredoxin [Leekyejoonella antrihumi]TWP34190.1 OsmC family peroxiredoxin [Leekyejoonella antrihumi]